MAPPPKPRGRGAIQPRPSRAFEAPAAIELFRVIGRRPSNVWVDNSGALAAPGPNSQRLREFVCWRTRSNAGDQIQERIGGFFVVTANDSCHPILLTPPEPLAPETAFVHAQTAQARDTARVAELVAEGKLIEVVGRRPKTPPSRPGDTLLPEDHPLVVDQRPDVLDETPAFPRRAGGGRSWS
ncbi:hypothetical protein STVA_17120 [Allostella vacuolata]|nr:hypothetical protein STVA_17120 [Stella vacuolata]